VHVRQDAALRRPADYDGQHSRRNRGDDDHSVTEVGYRAESTPPWRPAGLLRSLRRGKSMPVLSVFVAARAAARWLPDSLQSISRQVLPEGWRLQIRLGIDACEDTLAFAKGLRMPNLETRFFPQHVGPFVIFNSLAQATPSDILVRFDAADVMLEGYLGQQLEAVGDLTAARITHTWSILVDEQLQPTSAELFNGKRAAADGKRAVPTDGQFLMTRPVMDKVAASGPGGVTPTATSCCAPWPSAARGSSFPGISTCAGYIRVR
jgi:hypothetical protein